MLSVTLIGPDGAGKTTVTRQLEQSQVLRFRYLYMGTNIPASNLALPTTRLAYLVKRRFGRVSSGNRGGPAPAGTSGQGRGRFRAAARLTNRLAEQWFRQLVSWLHQARGYVVLYDRHFIFDFAPEIAAEPTVEKRLHRWLLEHLYPRPDLVIFLDAPGEVLFARKGESTVDELERRRQAFLRQGARLPNFVRVDATQPLAEVCDEVLAYILSARESKRRDRGSRRATAHSAGGVFPAASAAAPEQR
jgi:thymidylate kinase